MVVKPIWGTVRVVCMTAVVLEAEMVSPLALVQGTTVVISTLTVV